MSQPNSTAIYDYLSSNGLCTISLCPLSYAFVRYIPNLPGNAFYVALFSLLLFFQSLLGTRYKTYSFTFGMCTGLVLEVVGYIGRILMHSNPFSDNNFLVYIICLTIAPAFFSASIYLCLARIVVIYGEHLSRLRPRTYTITFITCDFIALVLQATGGGLANTGTGTTGTHIMVAGLSFQVASLLLFVALAADFGWAVKGKRGEWGGVHSAMRESRAFRRFLVGLAVATICILARSCYRVAELSAGFGSSLANNQNTFMVLEGGLISVACIVLTALHAGPAFGDAWRTADFRLRKPEGGWERRERAGGAEMVEAEGGGRKV